MRENGPVARDYPVLSSPELAQVGRLMKVAQAPLVQIESQNLSVTLRR
jgi:oxaloacetate decarboxylase alpha subunit